MTHTASIHGNPTTWEMTVCDKVIAAHFMGVLGGLFLVAPEKALGGIAPRMSATGAHRERVVLHGLILCLCLVLPVSLQLSQVSFQLRSL